MNSAKFSISLHILTLLASSGGELLTSEFLASGININPVLVRKELANLRKFGFIESKEGKNGGSYLAKPATQIQLSEVYKAVRQSSLLGQLNNQPNPNCPIGRQINQHLNDLFDEAELAMLSRLGEITLADFLNKFN
ncbi:Rrf2 family transcriptional regulator [Flectobacillus major]|uniref:Rrf2 family transcriptional regulator n=1 Tax=Flectobacillus major TaxID=103 RepID=UPI000425FD9F|nr:Rrf2 family transcriptional regulator [Flectobacillus major]